MKKLDIFTNELLKWNKVHKLTNYNKNEIKEQIKDSLYPLNYIKNPKTAIDIGTGAGFPGLILAIKMEHTEWYLVEPLKKRVAFLNYIKILLNLKNVVIVNKRLEESNLEKVDLITSRAVMKTEQLIEISKPFCKKNTTLLLYKGSNVKEEIKNLNYEFEIINKDIRNYLFIKACYE